MIFSRRHNEPSSQAATLSKIAQLRRKQPYNAFIRNSCALLFLGATVSWVTSDVLLNSLTDERTRTNLLRFWNDIRPYPLQGRDWDFSIYLSWLSDTFGDIALPALLSTATLSIVAIVIAGIGGFILSLLAARNLAGNAPFRGSSDAQVRRKQLRERWIRFLARLVLVFFRAIPEYIWAFVFLGLLGLGPWPPVLALAIHNIGVLGRLDSEVIENMQVEAPQALRALGAKRMHLTAASILPSNFNRLLLFFFYRWETCVREATVLGLLGFVSLGWFIQQARAGTRYDEMMHLVWLASLLILAGDFISHEIRRKVRR